jgi:hypothetical protein
MNKVIRLSVLVSLALSLNGCAGILASLSNGNQGGSQASSSDATASGNAPFDPATTCEQLTTAWSNQRQSGSVEAWNQDKVVYVRRALECNNSEAVFAGMLLGPISEPNGSNLLGVEQAGVPLKAAFESWLVSRGTGPVGQGFRYNGVERQDSLLETMTWAGKAGYVDLGEKIAAFAAAQDSLVQYTSLAFFLELRERGVAGEGIAQTLLSDTNPDVRASACNGLRTFGTAASLRKVQIISETDSYQTVRDENGYGVRVYPVREACAAALGQIQLRAE